LPNCEQYYVDVDGEDVDSVQVQTDASPEDGHESRFLSFLQLPHIQLSKCAMEMEIDYDKSLFLTEEDHVKKLEDLAAKREETAEERKRYYLDK